MYGVWIRLSDLFVCVGANTETAAVCVGDAWRAHACGKIVFLNQLFGKMKNWNYCCWLMSWKTIACVCDASNEHECACACVRQNFSPVFLKKTNQEVQAENNSQWHWLPKQSYCSIIHTQVNTRAHTHMLCRPKVLVSTGVSDRHTHTLQTADWVSWE